jgi:hypothetical protein
LGTFGKSNCVLITSSFYQNKDLLSSNCIGFLGYCQRKIKTILFISKSNNVGGRYETVKNLLKQYRQNELSLSYNRTSINQSLEKEHNSLILYELKERFKLIQDSYKTTKYRYIVIITVMRNKQILRKYNVKVSRQTVVNRAKDME